MSDLSERDIEKAWKEYNDSYGEPRTKDVWASDGRWRLVGNGVKSKENCGEFLGFKGCADTGTHYGVTDLAGNSYHNKAYVEYHHRHCDRADCPICYLTWATREGHAVEGKLAVHSEVYGEVYHVVASVTHKKWHVSSDMDEKGFQRLVSRVLARLKVRGIVGGVLIFHGFRYANEVEAKAKGVKFGWRWSPHFHILGFISDVKTFYRRCRDYYKGFFDDVLARKVKGDFLLVKKLDKRKSVFGTAWYQLNHASVLIGFPRFRVARWFGVARDHVEVKKFEPVCPVCQSVLKKLIYFGKVKLDFSYVELKGKPKRFFADIIDMSSNELVWAER